MNLQMRHVRRPPSFSLSLGPARCRANDRAPRPGCAASRELLFGRKIATGWVSETNGTFVDREISPRFPTA